MIKQHCSNCNIGGTAAELLPCPECGEKMHRTIEVQLDEPYHLVLVKTCDACPEQYDARLGSSQGETVGYLRMRHGRFVVQCPDVGEHTVYVGYPRGDGLFEEDERGYYLAIAVKAIQNWLIAGRPAGPALPPKPDVEFTVVDED